jgi:hypothetical protein
MAPQTQVILIDFVRTDASANIASASRPADVHRRGGTHPEPAPPVVFANAGILARRVVPRAHTGAG